MTMIIINKWVKKMKMNEQNKYNYRVHAIIIIIIIIIKVIHTYIKVKPNEVFKRA